MMSQVWARFWRRLLLLLAIALVFVVLCALRRLAVPDALLAWLAVALLAGLIPSTDDRRALAPSVSGSTGPDFAEDLRHFADALPDPCIVLDPRGVVLHRNAGAGLHFPGIVQGSPIAFALRFPALLQALEAARGGETRTVELHQSVPAESWYRVTIAPLQPNDPTAPLVVTLHSLTEERRLAALRSDFIANASHELRTPLTSLVGFIDTLLGPAANDAEARARFLGIMRGQAARMSKLIDDLLSLSRIEMRQHLRPTGSVELGGLLREVVEAMRPIAKAAETAIALRAPDTAVTVSGERDELYEVFENLIENAIKYGGGAEGIEVELAQPAPRPGFEAAVTVIDHGAGVAAEHVPRLTERFYRVDADTSRKKKGTGLGLAIVKHIVTRHHGELAIRSQPGQGTTVEVLLRK